MSGKKEITEQGLARAARDLEVDIAVVEAVVTVEAPRGGFQADGQVSILFEPHKFSEYTGGRFDKSHPDLSYPDWRPGAYGPYSAQHKKLARACELDRDAALMAASWGKPQILGRNWRESGAASLQDFINRMTRSEDEQLNLFVGFIKSRKARWDALKALDWANFARLYNGSAYRKNKYDIKLKAEYEAAKARRKS